MARPSTLAERIQALLQARGWETVTDRFTIRTVEPALEPIRHVWMAGEARYITAEQIAQVGPSRVVVQDDVRPTETERLQDCMRQAGLKPHVTTITRFVDFLWGAKTATQRARLDAHLHDELFVEMPQNSTPDDLHAEQEITLGGVKVRDHRLLETALSLPGSWLAVLADAGLGKSELLQWHEWKYAVRYDYEHDRNGKDLPSIAIRVPLRELRSLSLDGIAHYLSHPPAGDGLPALRQVDTGACLRQLLIQQRIVLLLDGVDEVHTTRENFAAGLRELRNVVRAGGRLVLSARLGDLMTGQSIGRDFREADIAHIGPMSPEVAHKLLNQYGADDETATRIYSYLAATPAKGIPLFLLLAYKVDIDSPLKSAESGSRSDILLELLRLFCERDEPRLNMPKAEQMRILTDFAHWANLHGELDKDEALRNFGIDPDGPDAAIFNNPHALLTTSERGTIVFKYPQFNAIFLAKALSDDWTAMGFASIVDDLRDRVLEYGTVEAMARRIGESQLRAAWQLSRDDADLRRYPLVRRNLLALILARLEDEEAGSDEARRSVRLAALLGGRVLEDVSLANLTLSRLDLADWRLHRLQGRGGALQYCRNVALCDADDSLSSFENTDGTVLAVQHDDPAATERGLERLNRLIKPLRRKAAHGVIRQLNIDECRDRDGWAEVGRAKMAKKTRTGTAGGQKAWVLTEPAATLLGRYATAADESAGAVRRLMREEPQLRELADALGRLRA